MLQVIYESPWQRVHHSFPPQEPNSSPLLCMERPEVNLMRSKYASVGKTQKLYCHSPDLAGAMRGAHRFDCPSPYMYPQLA